MKSAASKKISADDFERKYGKMVRERYPECTTARRLFNTMQSRINSTQFSLTEGLLKQWFLKYGHVKGSSGDVHTASISISGRAELEAKYGEILPSLADSHPSAYRLCKALRQLTPPVLVTDGVAK